MYPTGTLSQAVGSQLVPVGYQKGPSPSICPPLLGTPALAAAGTPALAPSHFPTSTRT